jgi:uncharacterized protein (TIGR00299 family) protein
MGELNNNMESTSILVVDPTDGLSGDMLLGCLFSLGVEPGAVEKELSNLPGLEPFGIVFRQVECKGIRAAQVVVETKAELKARNFTSIIDMIDRSPLNEKVKKLSKSIFKTLAEAEGKVHGIELNKVHFHEVGCVDSIVDIVGVVLALSKLGYPDVYHRPFHLGSGKISIAHGELAVPAPATMELLKGKKVIMGESRGEIVTPTGAVLMRELARELPPGMAFMPSRIVYSAGTRDPEHGGGILRVISAMIPDLAREVAVIRTTIDDMNPEFYHYLRDRLFDTGVHEVYYSQVIMKKSRPGVEVNVLCGVDNVQEIVNVILKETSTLGVRVSYEIRQELRRWNESVKTEYGEVEVKYAMLPGDGVKVSPEYESCRRLAESGEVSLQTVYRAAWLAAMKEIETRD